MNPAKSNTELFLKSNRQKFRYYWWASKYMKLDTETRKKNPYKVRRVVTNCVDRDIKNFQNLDKLDNFLEWPSTRQNIPWNMKSSPIPFPKAPSNLFLSPVCAWWSKRNEIGKSTSPIVRIWAGQATGVWARRDIPQGVMTDCWPLEPRNVHKVSWMENKWWEIIPTAHDKSEAGWEGFDYSCANTNHCLCRRCRRRPFLHLCAGHQQILEGELLSPGPAASTLVSVSGTESATHRSALFL